MLSVGIPRRARGEAIAEDAELRLFEDRVAWLEGGRLTVPLAACTFEWPLAALLEGDLEPDLDEVAEVVLLTLEPDGSREIEGPHEVVDALDLLAQGADDATLRDALDDPQDEALAWLRELGLVE